MSSSSGAPPTVLIVGGKLKVVRKARALGLRVVYVQRVDQFLPEHHELVAAAVLVDYTDWSQLCPLARAAYQAFGFGAVVSLTEPGLEPAARITDLLGLPGNPYAVSHLLRDKWAMRQHLARSGGPTVAATPVYTVDSLVRFGAERGYPVILKPRDGTASVGVFRVDRAEAVPAVWHKVAALRRARAELL
jgi:biotin carboxylase